MSVGGVAPGAYDPAESQPSGGPLGSLPHNYRENRVWPSFRPHLRRPLDPRLDDGREGVARGSLPGLPARRHPLPVNVREREERHVRGPGWMLAEHGYEPSLPGGRRERDPLATRRIPIGRPAREAGGRRYHQAREQAAGLEGAFSGHSARVGMARDLVAHGASVAAVQVAGRWASSRMPAYYARGEVAARGAVAQFYGD